ncbi:ATP-dependent Clp protease proteolytic subunit, partial [Bacillus sp. SS-TM]
PLEVLQRDTDRDNFMTAEKALEYGLLKGSFWDRGYVGGLSLSWIVGKLICCVEPLIY